MKHTFIILLMFCCMHSLAQYKTIDSLKAALAKEKADSNKVDILWELSKEYMYSKPDSALLAAQQGLFIARKEKDITGQMMTLKQMADVYRNYGNYPQSLKLYLETLQMDEKEGDLKRMMVAYLSIANLYQEEGDYLHAVAYAQKADSLINKYKFDDYRWYSYIGFGDLYEKMDSLPKSFLFNERAYNLAMKMADSSLLGMSLNNTGNVYAKAGKLDTALQIYYKGLPYLEKTNNDKFLCETYAGIAAILFNKGRLQEAIKLAKTSLAIAQEDGFNDNYISACELLTNIYKTGNRIDSSFLYQGKTIAMKDSLFSQAKVQQVENLTIEEKLRQNELDEQHKKDEENRARNLQLLLIGVLIPFFFLFSLILSKRKLKAKLVEFTGILSLLLLFEYFTLLLHPWIVSFTNDTPILEMVILVVIAGVLTPSHHRIEHWMLHKLSQTTSHIPILNEIVSNEETNLEEQDVSGEES